MKYLKTVHLLALSLLVSVSSFAQQNGDNSSPTRQRPAQQTNGPKGGNHQSRMLQHLLEMDDAQLNELSTTIKRIQGMSSEEKAAMKQRLGKLNKMPKEEVEAMRQRFEAIPKEQREAMRQRWEEMSTEERKQLREKLHTLPPEERRKLIEEAGIMPPRNKGGQKHGGPGGNKGLKGERGPHGGPRKTTSDSITPDEAIPLQ